MKKAKSRIILGTAVAALTLSVSACKGKPAADPEMAGASEQAALESTEEAAGTFKTGEESGAQTAETVLDFEKFDVSENYNNVVYGPPSE